MNKGPIRNIPRERLEGREDARLETAWVALPKTTVQAGVLGTRQIFFEDQDCPIDGDKDSPVLIMLQHEHARTFGELLMHGRANRRVYVLAPRGWGEGKPVPELSSCPTVLLRRVSEVPASGVYCAKRAKVWMGSERGGRAPWGIWLDEEQAEAFRQVFLRLFWHDALDEAWISGSGLSFRPAGPRPFDIPESARRAPLRLIGANAGLDIGFQGALLHLSQGAPPTEVPRRLWFPSGGSHHARLAELSRAGAMVVGGRLDLPDLALVSDRGAALLPGTRGRLRIELNSLQIADAIRILEQSASFRFGLNMRLGDYAKEEARFWLNGGKEAQAVEPVQDIDVGAMDAQHLGEMSDIAPSSWPSARPLALSVRYSWIVRPPRLPKGTDEDALVEQWRKVDRDWASRVDALVQSLDRVEEQRGRIGGLFLRLKSAMLGFGQTRERLLLELKALQADRPSALGLSKASAGFRRLSELEESARNLQREMEESEQKEREDLERDKQKTAWQSRVEEARRDLSKRREELRQREEQREGFRKELEDIKRKQEEQAANGDSQLKKDLKVRRQRVGDDLKKREDEIRGLQAEVEALEKRAQEVFEFSPPPKPAMQQVKLGGRFIPPKSAGLSVEQLPAEVLPAVGQLRRDRSHQRYLVIKTWEELACAEKEASRLNAKLVAPEDA